jgi:hypothetical protein
MQVLNNDELHLLITAAYSDLNQGLEQLRMFDKFMSEVEQIAQVEYDESGNVRFHEVDLSGRIKRDDNGNLIPLTALKKSEITQELPLNGCREWIRSRVQAVKWPATHSRSALKILERLS